MTIEEVQRNSEQSELSEGQSKPDVDYIYDVLRNSRCRAAIQYIDLKKDETPVEFSELVDAVAMSENSSPTDKEWKSVYATLHQNHIPRLEDWDIIEFSEEKNGCRAIRFPEEEPGELFEYLALFPDFYDLHVKDRDLDQYFVSLSSRLESLESKDNYQPENQENGLFSRFLG